MDTPRPQSAPTTAEAATGQWLTLDAEEREAHWQSLLERQRELEDLARTMGATRFTNRLQKAAEHGRESTAGGTRSLLSMSIEPTSRAITHFVEEQRGKRGVKHCALQWVDLVGHDVAAYITAKVVLDGISRNLPLSWVARDITRMILDELRYRRFQSLAKGLFNYKMARFTTSSYAHMARSMNAAMRIAACDECRKAGKQDCKHLDCSDLQIPQSQQVLIGAKLVDLLIEATSLVELEHERRVIGHGRRRRVRDGLRLVPAKDTLEWLARRNAHLEYLDPVSFPMVVPPLPWAPGENGGYRYALRGRYPLVRSQRDPELAHRDMPLVYAALNALQNTPWRVNQRVLEVVEALAERGGSMAGIPNMHIEADPERPADIDTNDEARRAWRKRAHRVKEQNIERARNAMAFGRVVDAARRVRDDEAIFFPYNLDFRGRIYPITTALNPQGDDLAKGLLTFAQGKPIGSDEAAGWLAVHGANCLDKTPDGQKVSKMTLQERVEWIEAHSVEILQVAGDPLVHSWWMLAGEPLQFLAFCFEWAGFQREGLGYVCSLPIAQDGSCNGLQHFSAMFRDEIGGAAVNLIPAERPNDVYDIIAQKVLAKLEDAAHEDDIAMLWLSSGIVNRSLCKRPTMTFSYGSKPYGFQEQLLDYLRTSLGNSTEESKAKWIAIQKHFMDAETETEQVVDACGLMSQLIWESLREVVRAAFDAMQWLQKCARAVVKGGQPVEWITPTGFKVRQEYFVETSKQVKTILAGKVIQPRVYDTLPEILTHKQVNAISPNVVHSLDASALMLTVTQASDEGVEYFAAVHDSYGTLPADMPLLSRITRQSFVRLYTSWDVVADLARQFQEQAPDAAEIPEPPAFGKLDVGHVIASDYFFC